MIIHYLKYDAIDTENKNWNIHNWTQIVGYYDVLDLKLRAITLNKIQQKNGKSLSGQKNCHDVVLQYVKIF